MIVEVERQKELIQCMCRLIYYFLNSYITYNGKENRTKNMYSSIY